MYSYYWQFSTKLMRRKKVACAFAWKTLRDERDTIISIVKDEIVRTG